jgi:nicotinate phosphoribosyltransferase
MDQTSADPVRCEREPVPLIPLPAQLGLFTDLYELTMAAAYWSAGLAERRATFDLFYRELPPHRNFIVAAGLEQAIHYLLNVRFSADDISYLRGLPVFRHVPAEWFNVLGKLHFTGDVWAVPEGTVVFPGEPLLQVTAPIMEAQIVETYLLASLAYPSSVATKAARIVSAAGGRSLVDFGTRRAHGPQAGLLAARASFIAGFHGTSNTLAAHRLRIPPLGTMAHSWIMAVGDERHAFQQFAAVFPHHATFLVDTYDTLEGARNAVRCGTRALAIRLDSGDLATLSRQVRRILDDAGWHGVTIFASGDLNEYKIQQLVAAQCPIDGFGIGTELATVADAPSLSVVYKLAEFESPGENGGRIKLSPGKFTYPHRKQVFRRSNSNAQFVGDAIALASESLAGEPLLEPCISAGTLTRPLPSLVDIQLVCRRQIERLPQELRAIDRRASYPVEISTSLQAEFNRLAGGVAHT